MLPETTPFTSPRHVSNPVILGIFVGLVLLFLMVIGFFSLQKAKADEKSKLSEAYYEEGLKYGYQKGMAELDIFKVSAIKSGVARYEIIDELTGESRFVWVTSSNTVPFESSTE